MIEILHEYWKPLLWTDGYALLDKDGLIPRILSRQGTDVNGLTAAAKDEIEKLQATR